MTNQRQPFDPLNEINPSKLEEIMACKWIESEKAGHDIGWESASQNWTNAQFPDGKRHIWAEAMKESPNT